MRYALPAAFAAATVLALLLLWDIARERPGRQQLVVLGLLVFVLTLTGAGLFFVYRAYSEARERLSTVKLYANDILQDRKSVV